MSSGCPSAPPHLALHSARPPCGNASFPQNNSLPQTDLPARTPAKGRAQLWVPAQSSMFVPLAAWTRTSTRMCRPWTPTRAAAAIRARNTTRRWSPFRGQLPPPVTLTSTLMTSRCGRCWRPWMARRCRPNKGPAALAVHQVTLASRDRLRALGSARAGQPAAGGRVPAQAADRAVLAAACDGDAEPHDGREPSQVDGAACQGSVSVGQQGREAPAAGSRVPHACGGASRGAGEPGR